MANKNETVVLKFDGDPNEYKLVFDYNAVCDAEEAAGCNLLRPAANPANLTSREHRALLFAALKTHHPRVLLTEAGDLLSRHPTEMAMAMAQVYGWTATVVEEPAEAAAEEPAS